MDNPPRIRHLSENSRGRDFVLGDLHGTTGLLSALMRRLRFDEAADRLFCVGDLVDRGPDSPGALELLQKPWFVAVKGNHEAMLEDYLRPDGSRRDGLKGRQGPGVHAFLLNGGSDWFFEWSRERTEEDRVRLFRTLSDLPLLLVVGQGSERFHVVHADLVRAFEAPESDHEKARITFFTDAQIDAGLPWEETRFIVGKDAVGSVEESLLWDRSLVAAATFWERGRPVEGLFPEIPSLSRTYVGHTPVREPLLAGSHRLLDTGAPFAWKHGTGLSLCDPRTDTIYTARSDPYGGMEIERRAFRRMGG